MPYIQLSGKLGKNKRTLVDKDIFEKYGHLTWHLSDTGYAIRRSKLEGGTVRLHRLVAQTPEGMVTDHKNHDRLDNRLNNLRIVTQKENMSNYKGEKGYTWDASKSKWMVRYKGKFYGRYVTEQEAAIAYKLACSGVPKISAIHPRRKYLPRGVLYMASNNKKYYVRPQINGKRMYIGSFDTAQEAEIALNNFLEQGGLTS